MENSSFTGFWMLIAKSPALLVVVYLIIFPLPSNAVTITPESGCPSALSATCPLYVCAAAFLVVINKNNTTKNMFKPMCFIYVMVILQVHLQKLSECVSYEQI